MACFCREDNKVNLVHVYQDNKLLVRDCNYFQIVYCPKICILQRLIKCDSKEKTIRIIIKILNFEHEEFTNISLINKLNPSPKQIIYNHLDGVSTYDNYLRVDFYIIPEVSSLTVDYCAVFEDTLEVESFVYICDKCRLEAELQKFKCCSTKIKLS